MSAVRCETGNARWQKRDKPSSITAGWDNATGLHDLQMTGKASRSNAILRSSVKKPPFRKKEGFFVVDLQDLISSLPMLWFP